MIKWKGRRGKSLSLLYLAAEGKIPIGFLGCGHGTASPKRRGDPLLDLGYIKKGLERWPVIDEFSLDYVQANQHASSRIPEALYG
jgi:hypothetical protein